jgi:hypothetical protein
LDIETAKAKLISHHVAQEYHPGKYHTNVVNAEGKFLGSYIPYIGKDYFRTKPQVLIYAMSQNLARATGSVTRWWNRPDQGILRQYYYPEKPSVSITPYDDGHLKIIAALALDAYPNTNYKPSDNVNDKIAVTNFVKFSFYRHKEDGSHLDANPPRDIYDAMWRYYAKYEVELLQPNCIIGVGNDVATALRRRLQQEIRHTLFIMIPFPGRLNLNSRWVPEGKRIIRTEGYDPGPDKLSLRSLLRGTPGKAGLIRKAIQVDWYYFREMKKRIAEKVYRLT